LTAISRASGTGFRFVEVRGNDGDGGSADIREPGGSDYARNRRQGDDAKGRGADLCHYDSPMWPRRRQLGANQPGDHGSLGLVGAPANQAVGMEWEGVPTRRRRCGVTMDQHTPGKVYWEIRDAVYPDGYIDELVQEGG